MFNKRITYLKYSGEYEERGSLLHTIRYLPDYPVLLTGPRRPRRDQRGNTTTNPTPETGHRHHIDSCTPSHRHDPTDNQHRTSFVHVELETLEIEQLREASPEQVDEDGLEAEDHEKATSEEIASPG
eukprot:g31706.t1